MPVRTRKENVFPNLCRRPGLYITKSGLVEDGTLAVVKGVPKIMSEVVLGPYVITGFVSNISKTVNHGNARSDLKDSLVI